MVCEELSYIFCKCKLLTLDRQKDGQTDSFRQSSKIRLHFLLIPGSEQGPMFSDQY